MSDCINREEFIKLEQARYCRDCERRKGMKCGKKVFCFEIGDAPCRACGVDDILTDLEDSTVTELQEVKHGRWEINSVYIKCSECGEAFLLMPQNYCPHCGADMRQGGQNE